MRKAFEKVIAVLAVTLLLTAIAAVNVDAQKRTTKKAAPVATRLTGTYRLNPTIGDNAQTAAERYTQNLPETQRRVAFEDLLSQLQSAEMLAIERRAKNVTIATSNHPKMTFVADGVWRTENAADGSWARVRMSLVGDQLVINHTTASGNESTITFDLIDAANRLSVTKHIYNNQVNQKVMVQSFYDRTSELSRWEVYGGPTTVATATPTSTPTTTAQTATYDSFFVPDGTSLVGVLNEELSTKLSKDRDRFTLTVSEPSKYAGATIEGYVTNVKRSGKITGRSEMTFNFDRIHLANGRSYKFAGIVETLRTAGGEKVSVDNEGAIKEGETRTSTTGKRAAVGTAVGAIIGAIAGGGKGAAIGAIVGAGAGAGSVYIQGRDDLELAKGTEVSLRATAPAQ
jgi:type IV secretion system protein VirB10